MSSVLLLKTDVWHVLIVNCRWLLYGFPAESGGEKRLQVAGFPDQER